MSANTQRAGARADAITTRRGASKAKCVADGGRLPDEEWKFDVVPDDEVEACFWWEYIRTGLDKGLRARFERQWQTAPNTINEGSFHRKIWGLPQVASAENGPFEPRLFAWPWVLHQLTRLDDVSLSEKLGKRFGKQTADFFLERYFWKRLPGMLRKNLACSLRGYFPPAHVVPIMVGENYSVQRWELRAEKDSAGVMRDCQSVFRVKVDWRFKDDEILEGIRRSLRESRPPEWPERTRPYGGSVASSFFCTTTYKAALGWLGVLRRAEGGCRWCHFHDVYGTATDEPDLRKQAKWAKAIIEWMTDGKSSHLDCLPAEQTRRRRAKD